MIGDTSGLSGRRQELEIFFVDLVRSEAALDAEERQTPRLSEADLARAHTIADEEGRRLWRAARIATRIVLERTAGESLRGVPFQIGSGGRPGLADGAPHFSISHSGDAALVAVAKAMPVGIDLERKDRALQMSDDRRLRIIRAAGRLNPALPLSARRDTDVLAAWVRLEAVAKALGTGIGSLLTKEGVIGAAGMSDLAPSGRDIEVRSLTVDEAYVGAIAAHRLPDDLTVRAFPSENFNGFLER
jgi:4'-phosphopantetheinyl transferase